VTHYEISIQHAYLDTFVANQYKSCYESKSTSLGTI